MEDISLKQGLEGGNGKDDLETVGEDFRQAASSLIHGVEKLGRRTKEIGKRTKETGERKITEMESRLEGYVQQHPMRVLMVAAGAGLLIGLIARRRKG